VVLFGVLWNLLDQNPQPDASPGIPAELEILHPRDGAVVDTARLQVRGTAPVGAEIVLTRRSAPDIRATAEGDGEWFMTIQLDSGVNELVFTIGSDPETEVRLRITYEPPAEPEPTPAPVPATTATANMIGVRANHTATLLPNGTVLVAGGDGGGRSLASAELYDSGTESWTATGNLIAARYGHTATLLTDGRVLVAGGNGLVGGSGGPLASAELYDPATGSWVATLSMGTPRQGHTATLLPNGTVLVAGGAGADGQSLASAELYDPVSRSWTATGNLDDPRQFHTATLLPDGTVLVAGGVFVGADYHSLASAELYEPSTGSWTATGSMHTARSSHATTPLPNGTVLVAGGAGADGQTLASAELYDPVSRSWTATGSMDEPRQVHTVTLLRNGDVIVAGGADDSGFVDSVEIYRLSIGSWTAPGVIDLGRTSHTATALPNGNLLLAGGFTIDFIVASAELYEPSAP
jgi:N-acetylneuraminic acid mutarotase